MRIAIVTATTDVERARGCLESWARTATEVPTIFIIHNNAQTEAPAEILIRGAYTAWVHHPGYMGSVATFRQGVDAALRGPFDVIACFHDDLEIQETGWDATTLKYFERSPRIGLAGFGGATGLGSIGLYDVDYNPMHLARVGFRSNLVDAETHGIRSLLAEPVACLDGFSQIGRREFWEGRSLVAAQDKPAWRQLQDLGFIHHFYDGALGCLAARHGWETWYLPIRCKHYGGRTAVGDEGYQRWAKQQTPGGDHDFWEQAHRIGFHEFADVLPIRV